MINNFKKIVTKILSPSFLDEKDNKIKTSWLRSICNDIQSIHSNKEIIIVCSGAIIMQDASTQFADSGEFGFGAEIRISTDELHVIGPVGAEYLTTFKYVIHGNGQVRT